MLDLVEILFARHGIQSLRYDGKMNREARESVLAQFRKTTGPKVILIRYGDRSYSPHFSAFQVLMKSALFLVPSVAVWD